MSLTRQEMIRDIAGRLSIPYEDAEALRRASMTLSRWAELECGDGNDYCSWCLERHPNTNKPYIVTYSNKNSTEPRWRLIPDREAGALRRVKAICERNGLSFYHQTDPRGAALYVARQPIPENDYTRGTVAVCK